MIRRATLIALISLLPLAATTAEEETPAGRLERVVAAFPAPSASAGFHFDGRILAGGVLLGECTLYARAERVGDRWVWETVEKVSMRLGPDSMSISSAVRLTSDFRLIDGSETEVEKGARTTRSFRRTPAGYLLTTRSGDQVEETEVSGPERALSGLASTALFCRLAREAGGEFEVPVLETDPDEGREHVGTARLELGGVIDWHGTEAHLAVGVLNDRTARFVFDPESHELLGFRMSRQEGVEVEVVATAIAEADSGEAAFTPPAETPEEAALIAALAFGSGDGALLARIVHWPSLYRAVQAERPDPELTEEVLRHRLVSGVNANSRKRPREIVLRGLGLIRTELEVVRHSEDRATVKFPASFKSMTMTFGRFEEGWLLVALPES